MRNNRLYELSVYSGKNKHNNMLFRFIDSLNLLPGNLESLANNLCNELGKKGLIKHEEVSVGCMKEELIDYIKQDIRLLGGVMQKAQEIY